MDESQRELKRHQDDYEWKLSYATESQLARVQQEQRKDLET